MSALTQRAGVHVLDLGAEENRFDPDWLDVVDDALDQVLTSPAPLVTLGSGRFYSNGLDLDWLAANPDRLASYTARVESLLARVLTLPVATVAAVNGHAFGAGAMLALAHDWRVIREDRGYVCLPEVDLHIPFTPGMSALVQAKLTPRQATDSMTTGRRFGGADAVHHGLVDATASETGLLDAAAALVTDLAGKDAQTLGAIKTTMHADAVRALRGATPR